jgi:hypothetical protein
MLNFITLLVYELKTVDGNRNSAKKLIEKTKNPDLVVEKILMKYKIMKFRMKISYMAFEKKKSVKELLLDSILKTYIKLFKNGIIPMNIKDLYYQQDSLFEELNNSGPK